MKRKLLLTLLVVLVLVCIFALTSCEGIVIPGITGSLNGPNSGENLTYLVKYYYDGSVIHQQSVKSGNALTSFQIEEKNGLGAGGVYFTNFYADSEMTTEFDFNMKITRNVNVYCQILHTVSYYYGNTKVKEHKVDALSGYLSQAQADEVVKMGRDTYEGFYLDKAKTVEFNPTQQIKSSLTVYCVDLCIVDYVYIDAYGTETSVSGLRQRVDTATGFTEEQKKEIYEYKHNGFLFDAFYSDKYTSDVFDFDTVPKRDIVIYCERDERKAGAKVTWSVSEDGKTITFEGNGDMYDYKYNTDVPWYINGAKIENIVIKEGITSVAGCAFYKFNKISRVTLPSTIKRINKNAFYMSSVTEINFPNALESIGTSAFSNCEGLVHLDFNEGLIDIEKNAFNECTSLTTVVLTPTIMGFGANAFNKCTSIESSYYIGTEEQFNKIDKSIANFWIDQLSHKYFISPEKPEKPGPYWYYNDKGEICQWYYTIWYYASSSDKLPFTADYIDVEQGILQANIDFMNDGSEETGTGHHGYKFIGWYLKDGDRTQHYTFTIGDKYNENIKLVGDRGKLCGDNVQWSFNTRTSTLTISRIDKTIADGDMWDFTYSNDAPWWNDYRTRITNIVIEDGVTHIGSFAFSEIYDTKTTTFKNLSYIVIPKSVTSVHNDAFYRCLRLLYIYYEGTSAELYGTETEEPLINGLSTLKWLNEDGSVAKVYANATGLDFSTLGEGAYWANMNTGASQNNKLRVAWSYDADNSTLLVGGGDDTHIMINYVSHSQTPWYSYRDDVTKVIINDNINTVGHYSFENMESVTEIVVPTTLAKISASAFVGTGYYKSEYESNGVVYIYTAGSVNLRYAHLIKVDPSKVGELFIIPARTLSIAEKAFEGCSNVKKLVLTKDIRTNAIYSTALSGLVALEEIFYDGNIALWSEYQNVPTQNQSGVAIKVLHYFKLKPSQATLEENGLTLSDCWHWKEKENSEPVVWEEET